MKRAKGRCPACIKQQLEIEQQRVSHVTSIQEIPKETTTTSRNVDDVIKEVQDPSNETCEVLEDPLRSPPREPNSLKNVELKSSEGINSGALEDIKPNVLEEKVLEEKVLEDAKPRVSEDTKCDHCACSDKSHYKKGQRCCMGQVANGRSVCKNCLKPGRCMTRVQERRCPAQGTADECPPRDCIHCVCGCAKDRQLHKFDAPDSKVHER